MSSACRLEAESPRNVPTPRREEATRSLEAFIRMWEQVGSGS